MDTRWQRDSIPQFISLLNQFYKASNFHYFFEQQKEIRNAAEQNFAKILEYINFEWFGKFYGELPQGDFNLIISLANGGGNYGPSVYYQDGKEEIFAIMGTWNSDSLGNPIYNGRVLSTVIHEFNHSFCNPLINSYATELLPQSNKFFKLNEFKLRQQAYGNATTLLCEILVRACVIKYMYFAEKNEHRVKYRLASEMGNGFMWITELYDALTDYENNRTQYPTLRSFMPEIVKVQNSLNVKKMQKEQDKYKPTIIGTNIKNGAKNVDSALDSIVVSFSKPMFTGANGSTYGKKGKDYFPEVIEGKWNKETKKEWILYVKLQPNTQYSLSFPAQFFISEEYYNPKETYFLDFKTK
jgi:hypothetical protein